MKKDNWFKRFFKTLFGLGKEAVKNAEPSIEYKDGKVTPGVKTKVKF